MHLLVNSWSHLKTVFFYLSNVWNFVPTSQRTQRISITNINRLMLFKKIIYSAIPRWHVHTQCVVKFSSWSYGMWYRQLPLGFKLLTLCTLYCALFLFNFEIITAPCSSGYFRSDKEWLHRHDKQPGNPDNFICDSICTEPQEFTHGNDLVCYVRGSRKNWGLSP